VAVLGPSTTPAVTGAESVERGASMGASSIGRRTSPEDRSILLVPPVWRWLTL
jgi:hypothetical protein